MNKKKISRLKIRVYTLPMAILKKSDTSIMEYRRN